MSGRPGWDEYFLLICRAVASRADCTRRQVGALVVRDNRIVSAGYNGAPAGQPGCLTDGACPRGRRTLDELPPGIPHDSPDGLCMAVHAEANAIVYGDYEKMRGATLYCTDEPCHNCRILIAAAGISRVVVREAGVIYDQEDDDHDHQERIYRDPGRDDQAADARGRQLPR